MELKLPPGFDYVGAAEDKPENETVSVIGVIVDYQPPVQSKGVDHMMTLKLTDHCYYNEGYGGMGVNVRIFDKQINLPTVAGLGDILLIRGFKRKNFNGNKIMLSSWGYSVMCFPAATISDPVFKHAFGAEQAPPHTKHPFGAKSSPEENYYVMALRDWASGIKDLPKGSVDQLAKANFNPPKGPSGGPPPPAHPFNSNPYNGNNMAPPNAPRGPGRAGLPPRPAQPTPTTVISRYQDRKFSSLKDIKDGTYVSLVGEVRKVWGTMQGAQMYLTDYTSNSLLFDYKSDDGQIQGQDGDEHGYLDNMQKKGWKGPFGKMTIQITLWPPHDEFVNTKVDVGDIVLVRNVHIAFRDKCLEGKLHTDNRFPQQVDVREIPQTDPLVLAMKARRTEYEQQKAAAENKKPAQSKAEKKKKKKKEKDRLARLQRDGEGGETPDSSTSGGPEPSVPKIGKINANVIAGNEHQPCLTIPEFIETPHLETIDAAGNLMTLPFVNQRVRSRVRVVDFAPNDIRDFARSLDDDIYNGNKSLPTANRWEWAFYILVEDAKPVAGEEPMQLPLQVFGEEGIKLLGLEAPNLRQDSKTLSLLKEKLFTLWGDLEEVKSAGKLEGGISNKPFECCIKEFGVKEGDEWVRTHAICDTQIK